MSLNSHREVKINKMIMIESIIEIYKSLDNGEGYFNEPTKRLSRKILKRMTQQDLSKHLKNMTKSIDNRTFLWYTICIESKGDTNMKNIKKVDEAKALRDVRSYAKNFLKESYDIDLDIPVELNGRLSSSLGRFIHTSSRAVKMDFSKNLIKYYEMEEIIGTIKHECVHYALFLKNKPFDDGDDYFEKELKKHGAPSTMTSVHRGKIHEYKCDCKVHISRRKFNPDSYRCSKCKGNFSYLGVKIV